MQICFLVIRRKSVLHVQSVFLLLVLKPFSLSSPFSITRLIFFCLHVLLPRASLLALAKSIYYNYTFTISHPRAAAWASCILVEVSLQFSCHPFADTDNHLKRKKFEQTTSPEPVAKEVSTTIRPLSLIRKKIYLPTVKISYRTTP